MFTADDTWDGGFYELAIELGIRSDERLQTALETIWQYEDLDGCYGRPDLEPSHQPRLPPILGKRMLGVATLPNGKRVACGTFVVREEAGLDWIGFYLPMGTLDNAYGVGAYPFGDDQPSRPWREPLDDWLARIAVAVFNIVPFPLALIGHEVSGTARTKKLQATGVPEERWIGYLWREGERLVWHPPTKYDDDFTFDD